MAASVGRGALFILAAPRCGMALLGIVVQTVGFLVAVDGHGWHGGVYRGVVGHA
jgi:hypothetical protein